MISGLFRSAPWKGSQKSEQETRKVGHKDCSDHVLVLRATEMMKNLSISIGTKFVSFLIFSSLLPTDFICDAFGYSRSWQCKNIHIFKG